MNIHRIGLFPWIVGSVVALGLALVVGCDFTSEELAEADDDASEDVGEVSSVGDAAGGDVGDDPPDVMEADTEDEGADSDPEIELPEACVGASTNGLYAVPSELDFAAVAVGETKILQVLLVNCGTVDRDIEEWNWAPDTGQFSFSVAGDAGSVPIGEAVMAEVSFTPSAPDGPVQTLLEVIQSGPTSPVEIPINGMGL